MVFRESPAGSEKERGVPSLSGLSCDARGGWFGRMLNDLISTWLTARGVAAQRVEVLADGAGLLILVLLMLLAHRLTRRLLLRWVSRFVERTSWGWDDVLLRCGVFNRLAHISPALVITLLGSEFFARHATWNHLLKTLVNAYVAVIIIMVIDAALNAVVEFYSKTPNSKRMPLKGFVQGAKLVVFLLGGIFILSIGLGRSPLYLLSGLGALTAVLLLVFRDALLGLVAGIQISVNQMVQIGDWIEMPKYGADGDVIDVTLTTVKVQNWDKTISTVPTYALISDPVKNWRGMQETGGRRIKRSLYLDMQSVKFLDERLMKKMLTFARLRPYMEEKIGELKDYNERTGEDLSVPVNGRRLTNLGCFRAYIQAYLRTHAMIHQNLTLLVRHLQPTDKGLPMEIYAFTSDTRWAAYESIQADIFDHLLAIVGEFELRVYQSPSGQDVKEAVASLVQGRAERG